MVMELLEMIKDKAEQISSKLYGMNYDKLDLDRQEHILSLAHLDTAESLAGSEFFVEEKKDDD